MKKKKTDQNLESKIKINKKDSTGLFSGKYKSVQFESKKYKKEKYKKNIKDIVDPE